MRYKLQLFDLKHLIYILLFCFTAQSQSGVSLSVFQDVKFAIQGDEARGYKAGTLDIVARFKMQGNQDKYGYLIVFPEYEYAEIDGIYKRYSVNVGYTLNKLIIKNLEITPSVGYGWIDRYGLSTYSYSLGLELMYKLSDRFKIGFNNQLTQRSDLKNLWGKGKLGYSFFAGIEYKIYSN